MRRVFELLINAGIRGVLSIIAIYLLNQAFLMKGLDIGVAINLYTFTTCTILGFPGLIVLYVFYWLKFL